MILYYRKSYKKQEPSSSRRCEGAGGRRVSFGSDSIKVAVNTNWRNASTLLQPKSKHSYDFTYKFTKILSIRKEQQENIKMNGNEKLLFGWKMQKCEKLKYFYMKPNKFESQWTATKPNRKRTVFVNGSAHIHIESGSWKDYEKGSGQQQMGGNSFADILQPQMNIWHVLRYTFNAFKLFHSQLTFRFFGLALTPTTTFAPWFVP